MTCKNCEVFEACKLWINGHGPEPHCPEEEREKKNEEIKNVQKS